MDCKYFGECGSCKLYNMSYEEQLNYKVQRENERFNNIYNGEMDIIKSEESHFRNRAEFRIFKNYDEKDNITLSYIMHGFENNKVFIDECKIVNNHINKLMPKILKELEKKHILCYKLYTIEFLTSLDNDMLVTLIYHIKLDEEWAKEAKKLQDELNINIIGRSRGQKLVLEKDYVIEKLNIKNSIYKYEYKESSFTQPNSKVNEQMIKWVLDNATFEKDLCELYCGCGNFTIPLSKKFDKVIATEISKSSINSALKNCELNGVNNIEFIRMSSEEFVEALENKREFNRLKNIDLKSYTFSTVFLDPPRAGLDITTTNLAKNFTQIIYISCNPVTLHRDLEELTKTHKVVKFALFDQFAYSNHIECGVILSKID